MSERRRRLIDHRCPDCLPAIALGDPGGCGDLALAGTRPSGGLDLELAAVRTSAAADLVLDPNDD